MDIQEELLRQLLDSNQKSHDQLVSKTDALLCNQGKIEKELHTLVTNQVSVIEDITEIKDNIKNLEDGRIKELEDRLKVIEDERKSDRHFWERAGKIAGGVLLVIGIASGVLKLLGAF